MTKTNYKAPTPNDQCEIILFPVTKKNQQRLFDREQNKKRYPTIQEMEAQIEELKKEAQEHKIEEQKEWRNKTAGRYVLGD